MGSLLGPTLANIIMTEFETVIVKPLINSGKIVFYKPYVDDTLVLAKPSDIEHILHGQERFLGYVPSNSTLRTRPFYIAYHVHNTTVIQLRQHHLSPQHNFQQKSFKSFLFHCSYLVSKVSFFFFYFSLNQIQNSSPCPNGLSR